MGLNGGVIDLKPAYQDYVPPTPVAEVFSRYFELTESFGGMRRWGHHESTDAVVHQDGEHVTGMYFRLDMSNLSKEIVNAVVEIAKSLDCYLYFYEHQEIEKPNASVLRNAAQRSLAAKFVHHWDEYLDAL